MDQGAFSQEALMAILSHLLDNKAQGVGFVAMGNAIGCYGLGPGWASTTTSVVSSGGGDGMHDDR